MTRNHTKASRRKAMPSPHGLAESMARVLKELARAVESFEPGAVHDLRVALRRCRTMAGALQQMNDYPGWARAKRKGKRLFQSLGDLRDVQVMAEWGLRLGGPGDPVRLALLARLLEREERFKEAAIRKLKQFPAAKWKDLTGKLLARDARFAPDGQELQALARLRLAEAWELHRRAVTRPTTVSWISCASA